jgi:hypothetical protein
VLQQALRNLSAWVEKGKGSLVSVRWDFEGSGRFGEEMKLKNSGPGKSDRVLKVSHIFNEPGTFFPSVLVASQRDGNTRTPFTLIRNIGRARVEISR